MTASLVCCLAFSLHVDGRQELESTGDEVCLTSGRTSAVKSEASIIRGIHDGRCSSPEVQNGDGKEICTIHVGSFESLKSHEYIAGSSNNGVDTVEDKQGLLEQGILVSAAEEYVSAPDAGCDQLGKMETSDVEESGNLLEKADLHFPSRQDIGEKESRSCVPQVRPRSLLPGDESEDGNKRPAIICEYFTKGWCIKGGSCRFLHKRDHVDNATQVAEDVPHTKGSEENATADASDLLTYNPPFSVVENINDYLRNSTAGKDIRKEHGEGFRLRKHEDKDKSALLERMVSSSHVSADSQKSSSCKDGSRSISTHREVEAEIFIENRSSNYHEASVAEGGSMLQHNLSFGSRSSSRELGVFSSADSIVRLVEESAALRRRYSLDAQSTVPSYNISSWKSSSLLRDSAFFSGSDSGKFSDVRYAEDKLIFKYKTTFTPYNWEPSVPFRSSYLFPPGKRSSDVQYDPFRDCIEQPDVGRARFRHSSYDQTQDVQSTSGRNSLELHKGLQIGTWDKNYNVHDKVAPVAEAESAATSASDAQNMNLTEEENPMVPGSVKAILKASRSVNDSKQSDLVRHGDRKVEKGEQLNELADEESKAIKYFRASLIEFVKELMKPIWHEGRLSKDVYKVIVQKAEDKILSTLQPNQVPNSSESIKQYLSSSQPKILKLIQAYVDKYGRF